MRPFALDSAPAHMTTVIVQSSSGALQHADRLRQEIEVGSQAAAHVTTQGATAVHKAAAHGATEAVSLRVGVEACLEYLPEPRVLFPDSELTSTIELDCAPDAIALIGDAFSWHDPEGLGRAPRRISSTFAVRVGGAEPIAIDSLRLDDFGALGRDYVAFGALTVVAPACDPCWADSLASALDNVDALYAAVSRMPGGTGVSIRLAGADMRAVRSGLGLAWGASRKAFFGEAPGRRRKE